MQFMSQDKHRLINGDYVSQFYIETTSKGARLIAAADIDIVLGIYDKVDHAEMALEFIGFCMVNEDMQGKVTQVPTREDMAMGDELFPDSESLKKAIARILSSTENPENSNHSGRGIGSILKGIFDY